MQFEWNPEKAELNLKKHEVDFSEAEAVLAIRSRKSLTMMNILLMKSVK